MEYEGKLLSVDSYMNVQLGDAKEYIDGQLSRWWARGGRRSNEVKMVYSCEPRPYAKCRSR